jgi:hypothetical protein
MYLSITLPHARMEGRAWASLPVLATCEHAASRRSARMLLAARAKGLWHRVEAAEVADAMIEAKIRAMSVACYRTK